MKQPIDSGDVEALELRIWSACPGDQPVPSYARYQTGVTRTIPSWDYRSSFPTGSPQVRWSRGLRPWHGGMVDAFQPLPTILQTVLDTTDWRGLAEFHRQLLGMTYRSDCEPDPNGADWLVPRSFLTDGATRQCTELCR